MDTRVPLGWKSYLTTINRENWGGKTNNSDREVNIPRIVKKFIQD